jgi:hypothetical protein
LIKSWLKADLMSDTSPSPSILKGIAVNLSYRDEDKLHKKVSPPFEGGVVGTIDYHVFTVFYFPTGVVDSLIFSYLYWYEKPKHL